MPKRKGDESSKQKTSKKPRRENWSYDDDLALLKLVQEHKFAWDLIKHDFHKHQHRKTEETEASLEKRWDNLKGTQSRYRKEFRFNKFKSSAKEGSPKYITEMAAYEEACSEACRVFAEAQTLIGDIKGGEILVTSNEPKTAEGVAEQIEEEVAHRKSVRENRLEKYLQYAEQDQAFQKEALGLLRDLRAGLDANKNARERILAALERG